MNKIPPHQIQIVSGNCLRRVVISYRPLGLFLCRDGRLWIAVDNSTGNAWTEEFRRKRNAIRWLRGAFEVYQ